MSSPLPYTIYCITNTLNGKRYIGQTTRPLDEREGEYRRGRGKCPNNSRILQAIRKYGSAAFVFDEIDRAESYDELNYMEQYWIAFYRTMDPALGYNILPGGRGKPRSAIARTNMSRAMKALYQAGHVPYNLGKPHSPETKRRMSEAGKRSIGLKGYGQRSRKEVRCLDTGIVYPSISAAARAGGFSSSALELHLKGRTDSCNGQRWEATANPTSRRYEGERMKAANTATSKALKNRPTRGCAVQCVETGEVFPSIRAAGVSRGIDSRLIFVAIEKGARANGHHWVRLSPKRRSNQRGHAASNRAVRCVETDMVYPSLTEAAKTFGVAVSTIWSAIKDEGTAGGKRWTYV